MVANMVVPCFGGQTERPVMYGELRRIEERVGHDRFPLIAQNYYADYKQMVIAPKFPCVVKVSHAHAGMGKIKLADNGILPSPICTSFDEIVRWNEWAIDRGIPRPRHSFGVKQ
jgi:hypothetical protein